MSVPIIFGLADLVSTSGAFCPILPRTPCFRGAGRIGAAAPTGSDLTFREWLRLTANAHRIHLNARIARQIDRKPHHLDDRARRRGKTVATHQRDAALTHCFSKVTPLRHVSHQKVGIAEFLADIPYRHLAADEAAGMDYRLQWLRHQP